MIIPLKGWMLILVIESVSSQLTGPIVATTEGPVQGIVKEFNGTKVNTFLGVPFAKPPVGKLRFRRPQLPPIRSQIYVADRPGPSCVWDIPFTNIEFPGSEEDCLYMDILVPEIHDKSRLLNVIIFIFGGGFNSLSPQWVAADLSVFPATQNVILVDINYRQGLFGFSYHEVFEKQFFGNIGFYDQNLAIRWVKKNIRNFGGDPHSITLWGQSAGAFSISANLISPYGKGLFKRAIITSGPGVLAGSMPNARTTMSVQAILDRTGCNRVNDKIVCLQKFNATYLATLFPTKLFPFLPTYNSDFVPSGQSDVYLDPQYPPYDVDLLIGIVSQDGSFFNLIKSPEIYLDPHLTYLDAIKSIFGVYKPDTVLDAFKWYILDFGYKTSNDIRKGLNNILTDLFTGCTSWEMSRRLLTSFKKGNIYAYVVAKKPTTEGQVGCTGNNELGACHGADLVFGFGLPFQTPEIFTDNDRIESAQIMRSYSTFAKTGKPTLPFSDHLPWPKFGECVNGKIEFPIVIIDSDNPGDIDYTYAKFCYRKFVPNIKNLIPKLLLTDRFPAAIQAQIDALH